MRHDPSYQIYYYYWYMIGINSRRPAASFRCMHAVREDSQGSPACLPVIRCRIMRVNVHGNRRLSLIALSCGCRAREGQGTESQAIH